MDKLEEILDRIGKRIAKFRTAKGMNQSDLARELDKDRQIIQRMETGKVNPTIKTLQKIADVLEIDIIDLIKK